MHNKVSSDWLPSYIKSTRPVLEIFKIDGYFQDSLRISTVTTTTEYVILRLSQLFLLKNQVS